jgi:hypothetical protein
MSYDDEEPDEVFAAPRSPNITLQNPNYDQKELNNYEEALTKIGMSILRGGVNIRKKFPSFFFFK